MPAMNHRQTTAVLNDIYDDYASVFTVPLTIDWGVELNEDKKPSVSLDKELPPPPPIPTTPPLRMGKTSPTTIAGRNGFGSSLRSRSPLSREWSPSDSSDSESSGLVRRSAMKRRAKRDSNNSVESIWFAPAGYNVSPPRSRSKSPDYHSDSSDASLTSHDTFDRGGGSVDTVASQHSRLRVFQNDSAYTTTEIHVGPLYEVLAYIWETMAQPCNVEIFKSVFGKYALPRTGVLNLVASNFMTVDNFLKSAELQVYINFNRCPPSTSLDTVGITLDQELVDTFTNARGSALQAAKGMLRIAVVQKVGEFIVNHILLYDGFDEFISPSIDLARAREEKGAEISAQAIFGGISSFGWYSGKLRVFFRKENKMYRIPHRVLGELYRNIKVSAFNVDELDL